MLLPYIKSKLDAVYARHTQGGVLGLALARRQQQQQVGWLAGRTVHTLKRDPMLLTVTAVAMVMSPTLAQSCTAVTSQRPPCSTAMACACSSCSGAGATAVYV